jgi:hypothetical protein
MFDQTFLIHSFVRIAGFAIGGAIFYPLITTYGPNTKKKLSIFQGLLIGIAMGVAFIIVQFIIQN